MTGIPHDGLNKDTAGNEITQRVVGRANTNGLGGKMDNMGFTITAHTIDLSQAEIILLYHLKTEDSEVPFGVHSLCLGCVEKGLIVYDGDAKRARLTSYGENVKLSILEAS